MKYGLLILPLLASVVLAATRDARWGSASTAEPAPAPLRIDPPWLTSDVDFAVAAGHAEHDPHMRGHAGHDPHVYEHAGHDPHAAFHAGEADPHAPSAAPIQVAPVQRSKAPQGRAVTEIFSQRASLNGEHVRLHATVVKLTEGILGKTYLHLQDGSGSLEGRDHDLTATTTEVFEVGETVEVEGRLAIDQDVGLGYRYEALLTEVVRVLPR